MPDTKYINADLLNTPAMAQRGIHIVPWQFNLFKLLSSQSSLNLITYNINVDTLLEGYRDYINSYGICSVELSVVRQLMNDVLVTPETRLVKKDSIQYYSFDRSLKWLLAMRQIYKLDVDGTRFVINGLQSKLSIHPRYFVLILTSVLDLCIAAIIWLHHPVVQWLAISRTSAVIILTNIAYLLIPFTPIYLMTPPAVLAKTFPSEYSHFYHKGFAMKIVFASILHVCGHIAQIIYAIEKCKAGCSQESIRIVPVSSEQTIISYTYFAGQYAYATGIVLSVVLALQMAIIFLHKKGQVRYSTNQMLHRLLGTLGFIMVIAHGGSNLLGFNYSLIFTLPLLLLYIWNRRFEIFKRRFKIERWHITDKTIRLYINDNKRLNKMLNGFGLVSVYINYPLISKYEWHPFTLSRGHQGQNATLTIQRVGKWTNALATMLVTRVRPHEAIYIGHYNESKFRFHSLYQTRYFFCAGVGITAFISVMMDMLRDPSSRNNNPKTVLIWSVNDIKLVHEFSEQIFEFQQQLRKVEVRIFYSNKLYAQLPPSKETKSKFEYLQSVIYGYHKIDIITGKKTAAPCMFQRANFFSILSTEMITINPNTKVGAFICGSTTYAQNVIEAIDSINSNPQNAKITIWSESV